MAKGELSYEFGKGLISFVMKDNGMQKRLREAPEKVQRAVYATMEYYAPQVEGYMKETAPWNDQTGNARNGLAARAFMEDDNMGIVLFHQVPYGIWLELAHSGEYAVIMPTVDHYGPIIMQRLSRLMTRMEF